MSERTVMFRFCDNCENIDEQQVSPAMYGGGFVKGWIRVTLPTKSESVEKKHFCSIGCLKDFAVKAFEGRPSLIAKDQRCSDGRFSPEAIEAFKKIQLP